MNCSTRKYFSRHWIVGLFCALLAPIAFGQSAPVSPLSPSEVAFCAATAARKAQVVNEAKTVLGNHQIDPASFYRDAEAYFKLACASSTADYTFNQFEIHQASYDVKVQAVAQRCRVTDKCLSEYMSELDGALARCDAYRRQNANVISPLLEGAPTACSIQVKG